MKKVNCITINTDASFHPHHKVGGYAFYIVCDLFKIQKSGKFKIHPKTSYEAELMCMANAISTLLAQKELPNSDWLILNTDCLHGISNIKKKKAGLAEFVSELWMKLIERAKVKHDKMKHVTAHNGTLDARSWVNDWCDKEAKKWMRAALKEKIRK